MLTKFSRQLLYILPDIESSTLPPWPPIKILKWIPLVERERERVRERECAGRKLAAILEALVRENDRCSWDCVLCLDFLLLDSIIERK